MNANIGLTEADARRLTDRIRTALDRVSTAWEDLAERIAEAYQRRADLALGYASWAEYAEAELRPSGQIAAEVRRQLVAMLSAQGMSTRAIAPTVGVSDRQAAYDRAAGVQSLHTSSTAEHIDPATGEVRAGPYPQARRAPWPERRDGVPAQDRTDWTDEDRFDQDDRDADSGIDIAPRTVIGLDGKTYARPEPKPVTPRRRALTDQFFDAAYDLNRRIESVHRLTEDDRFPRNANEIAQKHLSDLVRSRDLLQQVIDHLTQKG